jgi:Tfp pilus assembly protein PilO
MHDQEQGQMSMHAIAKTYRYLDAEYKIEIKS